MNPIGEEWKFLRDKIDEYNRTHEDKFKSDHTGAPKSGMSVCFCISSIPETDTAVVTMSVMMNGKKQRKMDEHMFGIFMSEVDDGMREAWQAYDVAETIRTKYESPVYFISMKEQGIEPTWYVLLNCHRIFFVPLNAVSILYDTIFSEFFVRKNLLPAAPPVQDIYINDRTTIHLSRSKLIPVRSKE